MILIDTNVLLRSAPLSPVTLVAAMDRHGIRHLLTFNDQHFRRFPEIEVIHPEHMDRLPPLPVRS